MKKTIVSLTSLLLAAGNAAATGFESRRFTPYFNMNMSQGGYLPDNGDFFTGANMGLRVGLLTKFTERNSLFALYNMSFSGQGFRFPDTQEFESKDLSHVFSFEHRWDIGERWRVRPGLTFGKTYNQTAAAEIWGQGLYDNKATGYSLAGDFMFGLLGQKATVTGQVSMNAVKFPNYTDIIREFRGADSNTELAGGLKDQDITEYSVGIYRKPYRARLRLNSVDFKREKIVEAGGTYSNEKQKDANVVLSGGVEGKLWIFESSPELAYQVHTSNQNFLLFRDNTDSSPVFAGNYYDYKELSFSAPFFVNLTKKWALDLGLDWQRRQYGSRQPRNSNNQFKGGKQVNLMTTLTAGFRKKMNEVSAMYITYNVVKASSNNKFENYLPYNYAGQGFSLGYSLTY